MGLQEDPAFNEAYYNQEYKLWPIWLGLVWWFASSVPYITLEFRTWWYWNDATAFAWNISRYGLSLVFWVLGIWWLIAYIKDENRLMSKYYYRAIAWGIPLTWLFWGMATLGFFIGSYQKRRWPGGWEYDGEPSMNFAYWLLLTLWVGGLEVLAWWLTMDKAVRFYKWNEQSWWNYNKDDAPENWPKQLGEFVDY